MNNRILLVDDEVNILNSYKRTLKNKFTFDVARSGAEALELIINNKYAVIITDMQMPIMNGLELLQEIKLKTPNTVRMMLTGNADQKTAIDALNIGDIFRFINKPCANKDLAIAIETGIKQYNLIIAEKVLLNKTLKGTINVLAEVLAVVNPEIFAHVTQIKKYMLNLAQELDMPLTWSFVPMIQLSQLGCIMFPDKGLMQTQQVTLSLEQRRMIEQHPFLAADLIKKIPRMKNIARTILYQEKCFNGEGIPKDDVKGEQIPFGARMLKIVLDFLRLKKSGSSASQACIQLEKQSQLYDPKILAAFQKSANVFITNTQELVSLTDLTDDMVIQENLTTKTGLLVALKGQKISEPLLRIISHCIKNGALEGNIIVTKTIESNL